MLQYIEYAVTWLFFMAIIAGICLLVPKIAPKIGNLFKGKSERKNPYDFGEETELDDKSVKNKEQKEDVN